MILVVCEADSPPVKLRQREHLRDSAGLAYAEEVHRDGGMSARVREGPARGCHWSVPSVYH